MKAMLLAAGAGTRLRPLTNDVPKPLAPIANVPLLERTLRWLKEEGVNQVIVNLHHHAEQIRDTIGAGERFGIEVSYSIEETLLGTSGAVKRCADELEGPPFFVIYGDNLVDADLRHLYRFHRERDAEATISLFSPDDPTSCGIVVLGDKGKVTGFVEKPADGGGAAGRANAGVYVMNWELIKSIPDGVSDFGQDVFPQWVSSGRRLFATELGGYLQDTGTPERYRQANWDVLANKLRQKPHGQRVGENLIGDGVVIDPRAELVGRNIIGEGCVIAAGVRLEGCILWNGAAIQSNARLADVIVGCDALVPSGANASHTIIV